MILQLETFLIKQILLTQAASAATKIQSTVLLAASFSPIVFVLDQLTHWATTNSMYVLFVFGAIIVDHILGSLIHLFIKRDFTFKKNIIGLVIKVGLVIAIGFLVEGIEHIVTEDNIIKDYIIIVLRLMVFMYPASSAFVNSSIVTRGKFPPSGFLGKITRFQKNLNVREFRGDNDGDYQYKEK